MKKLLCSLFIGLFFTISVYPQCINTGQFPNSNINVNNDGNPNTINTCIFTGDFSQLVNVFVGDDYLFTLSGNASGTDKYLTVTDGSDNVIASGESPLTVTNISSATIRLHYTEDAACTTESVCHTATYQNISACVAPENLAAVPTDSTAQLSWSAGSFESMWEVEVVLNGASPTGIGQIVNSPNYMASGLLANTNYDFYVRSDCGAGDFSIWVGPSTFLTLPTCPSTGDPFLINLFNDGAEIAWFANGSETMWDVEYGPAGFEQGTGTLVTGLTNTDYLISGQLSDTTYDAYVRAVCDGNDISPWSTVVTYTTLTSCPKPSALQTTNIQATSAVISWLAGQSETSWELEYGPTGFVQGTGTTVATVTNPHSLTGLDPDTTYDIYLRANCGGGDFSVWIGPHTFTTLPTCPQPTNIQVSNILTTSVDIDWVVGQSETVWEIEYGPQGFSQGTGTIIMTTNNPYNLTGLLPATSYDVYVRADCGAVDGLSQWTGPTNFLTICITFVAPYTEGFENGGAIPNCWSQGTSNNEDWLFATTGGHVGNEGSISGTTATNGFFAYVDDSAPDNTGTTLISPFIDISDLTVPALSFFVLSDNENNSNVTLNVDFFDGTTWNNAIFTNTMNTSGGWMQVFVDLTSFTITGDVQVRFVVDEPANGDFYDDIAIDDVTIDELPSCAAPTVLIAGATTSDSVNLSWNEGASETGWELEYGLEGFVQGTGTIVAANSNPFELTGLVANTTYDVYIRANCGIDGFSAWSGPEEFVTACTQFIAPYSEGFENGGLIPNCWTQGDTNQEDWNFENDPAFSHIGNNGTITGTTATNNYFAWVDDSSAHSLGTTLISPFVDVSTLAQPALSFYLLSDNEGNTNVNFSVDFYDGAAWNIGAYTSSTNTGGWLQVFIDLSAYSITGNVRARFIVNENNGTDFYDDVAIDDVAFSELPSCAPPTSLSAINITSNSADLNWAPGAGETAWEIVIQAPGTGIPAGNGTATTTNPYTATMLASNSSFEYYVRSNCGINGYSNWSGPYEFSTTPEYCSGDPFVDTGGTTGDYSNGENITYTICPNSPGDVVYVNFSAFSAENIGSTGCFDGMTIYNGGTTTAPTINPPNGGTIWCWDRDDAVPAGTGDLQGMTLISTDTSGCLTFVFTSDSSVVREGWIAAVTCGPPPTCVAPSELNISNVMSDSAEFSWTPGDTETAWNVELVDLSAGGSATGVPTTSGATNPYTFVGLTGGNTYEAYVQADCSAGTTSLWIGPILFSSLPSNNNICEAMPLIIGVSSAGDQYTNVGATAETGEVSGSCFNGGINGSVWFTFEAPASGEVQITTDIAGATLTDSEVAVYEAPTDCNNAGTIGPELGCDQDGGTTVNFNSVVELTGLTPGNTYYIQVDRWGTTTDGRFGIEVNDLDPLSIEEVEFDNFEFYPNPVQNNLTLVSHSEEITDVRIANLLGMEVLRIQPKSMTTQVDMSRLSAGVYLVTIVIANKSQTLRIIKD